MDSKLKSPFRAAKNRDVEDFEDNIVPTFLTLWECTFCLWLSCSRPPGMWAYFQTVPPWGSCMLLPCSRSEHFQGLPCCALKWLAMVRVSSVFLGSLPFSPVLLVRGCHGIHRAFNKNDKECVFPEFTRVWILEDVFFVIFVKSHSARSTSTKGSNLFIAVHHRIWHELLTARNCTETHDHSQKKYFFPSAVIEANHIH